MDQNHNVQLIDPAEDQYITELPLIEYRNGLYQGYFNENAEREGRGIYYWDSGEIYFGDWRKDRLEGEGILYFALGGYVYGTFIENKVHGYSVLCFPNADYIAGFWTLGCLNGKAIRYYSEPDVWCVNEYENGSLKKKLHQGKGIPPLYNFDTIEAHYLKKLMSKELGIFGFQANNEEKPPEDFLGHLAPDEESWYHGHLIDKVPEGIGILCYSEMKNVRGIFKKGHVEGPGRTIFSNGDVFDGFYKKGKFSGMGMYYSSETDQYLYGQFENNECTHVMQKGEGFPHDLIKNIKSNLEIQTSDFVDMETDSNVLTLANDDHFVIESNSKLSPHEVNTAVEKERVQLPQSIGSRPERINGFSPTSPILRDPSPIKSAEKLQFQTPSTPQVNPFQFSAVDNSKLVYSPELIPEKGTDYHPNYHPREIEVNNQALRMQISPKEQLFQRSPNKPKIHDFDHLRISEPNKPSEPFQYENLNYPSKFPEQQKFTEYRPQNIELSSIEQNQRQGFAGNSIPPSRTASRSVITEKSYPEMREPFMRDIISPKEHPMLNYGERLNLDNRYNKPVMIHELPVSPKNEFLNLENSELGRSTRDQIESFIRNDGFLPDSGHAAYVEESLHKADIKIDYPGISRSIISGEKSSTNKGDYSQYLPHKDIRAIEKPPLNIDKAKLKAPQTNFYLVPESRQPSKQVSQQVSKQASKQNSKRPSMLSERESAISYNYMSEVGESPIRPSPNDNFTKNNLYSINRHSDFEEPAETPIFIQEDSHDQDDISEDGREDSPHKDMYRGSQVRKKSAISSGPASSKFYDSGAGVRAPSIAKSGQEDFKMVHVVHEKRDRSSEREYSPLGNKITSGNTLYPPKKRDTVSREFFQDKTHKKPLEKKPSFQNESNFDIFDNFTVTSKNNKVPQNTKSTVIKENSAIQRSMGFLKKFGSKSKLINKKKRSKLPEDDFKPKVYELIEVGGTEYQLSPNRKSSKLPPSPRTNRKTTPKDPSLSPEKTKVFKDNEAALSGTKKKLFDGIEISPFDSKQLKTAKKNESQASIQDEDTIKKPQELESPASKNNNKRSITPDSNLAEHLIRGSTSQNPANHYPPNIRPVYVEDLNNGLSPQAAFEKVENVGDKKEKRESRRDKNKKPSSKSKKSKDYGPAELNFQAPFKKVAEHLDAPRSRDKTPPTKDSHNYREIKEEKPIPGRSENVSQAVYYLSNQAKRSILTDTKLRSLYHMSDIAANASPNKEDNHKKSVSNFLPPQNVRPSLAQTTFRDAPPIQTSSLATPYLPQNLTTLPTPSSMQEKSFNNQQFEPRVYNNAVLNNPTLYNPILNNPTIYNPTYGDLTPSLTTNLNPTQYPTGMGQSFMPQKSYLPPKSIDPSPHDARESLYKNIEPRESMFKGIEIRESILNKIDFKGLLGDLQPPKKDTPNMYYRPSAETVFNAKDDSQIIKNPSNNISMAEPRFSEAFLPGLPRQDGQLYGDLPYPYKDKPNSNTQDASPYKAYGGVVGDHNLNFKFAESLKKEPSNPPKLNFAASGLNFKPSY